MFDSLKKSISQFRQDVEEEAETVDDESEAEDDSDGTRENEEEVGLAQKAKSLAKGQLFIDEDTLEGPLNDLEIALLSENVDVEVVDAIIKGIKEELIGETRRVGSGVSSPIENALKEALIDVLSGNQYDLVEYVKSAEKPVTIVFTGINGVGKTTTIAKLSQHFEEQGLSTVLANGDTYRAGAEEQIGDHAKRLGTKLIAHEQGGDPTAVLYDAVEYAESNDVDVVLGDTAGRLHTDGDLMAQLDKIQRVVDPELTLFVDEAVAGQDAVNRVQGFDEAAPIDGVILTKAEATRASGAAVSMAHVTGQPVLYLGVGQSYDDIVPFDPEDLVESIVS